jgi:hypothetical protein
VLAERPKKKTSSSSSKHFQSKSVNEFAVKPSQSKATKHETNFKFQLTESLNFVPNSDFAEYVPAVGPIKSASTGEFL